MLSCAAIQKLERYGQLGLKRNTVEEFVASSLKDAKGANVYALTHQPTWQECLDAIQRSCTGRGGGAPLLITDALVYAVSFSASLITQHLVDMQKQQWASCVTAPAATAPAVFPSDDAASELLALLKSVAVQVARGANRRANAAAAAGSGALDDGDAATVTDALQGAGGLRLTESREFVQSLMHLLSTTTTMLFYALSVKLNSATWGHSGHGSGDATADLLWKDGLVLLSATARLLRRAAALTQAQGGGGGGPNGKSNDDPLFSARTANAMVKQFLAKHKSQAGKGGSEASSPASAHGEEVTRQRAKATAALETFPLLRVLLDFTNTVVLSSLCGAPMASGYVFLEVFSPLQRLSLLHAVLPEMTSAAGRLFTSATGDAAAAATRFVEAGAQRLLRDLLSPSACNKATRYVIYFRGDDLKLMQSKMSQPAQYALHTFTTTPPVEPTVLEPFLESATAGSDDAATMLHAEQQRSFYALLFSQWVVTAPFFFEAFCSDPSWTAFAQEQRRTALLRQAQDRRGRREERRKSKRQRADASSSRAASQANSDADSTVGGGDDDNASTFSAATDTHSRMAASIGTGRTMLSLESRASLLSTLSKQSAASYMSFLSVLKPTETGTGSDAGATRFHQSADGNTNLPLILLEELVLALNQFMEAIPAEALDRVGLRALCWQSIGRLYHFIQDSISIDGTLALGAAEPGRADSAPTIFNLGTDLRYNHGLGYESLGLLFAKVIAPQFEGADASEESDDKAATAETGSDDGEAAREQRVVKVGRASLMPDDSPQTRRNVETALSRCLAAYEAVAPQVVDMNLPTILRIAARTAAEEEQQQHHSSTAPSAAEAAAQGDVLYEFLAGIVQRLGKCNQVPMLLDALVNAESTSTTTTTTTAAGDQSKSGKRDDDTEEDVAALQVVCSHPQFRDALIQASGLTMDPENLLGHLLRYIGAWSLTGDDSGDAAEGASENVEARSGTHDPQHVLFVLKLVATVLEGIEPTSMTSSAVLERSTELEMLLTAFAHRHLLHKASASDDVESGMGKLFRGGALRPKMRRQLWLHTLYAIYQCRQVTTSCLHDLGLQNVKDYLALLNETLWQVDTHIGALLVLSPIDDDEEEEGEKSPEYSVTGGLGFADLAAQMSATTRMTMPPHVHVQALLPMLAVQRLALARSVSVVLGSAIEPAAEARQLAHSALEAIADGCAVIGEDSEAAAAMSVALLGFVNALTEEEWLAVAHFAKRKHLRRTLTSLLHVTHTAAVAAQGQGRAYAPPVWLSRCLRCAGGAALRAMTDMLLTFSTDDVVAGGKKDLLSMLSAFQYTYTVVGHVPFWPLLVERVSAWLAAMTSAAAGHESPVARELVAFLHCILSYEGKGGEVIRRALLLTEGVVAAGDSASRGGAATATATTRKGLSRAFLQQVGVVTEGGDGDDDNDDADGGEYVEDEVAAFAGEMRSLVGSMFTKDFAAALLRLAPTATPAMGVLAVLYHTAILTVRTAGREGRYYKDGVTFEACRAAGFIRDVADLFATQTGTVAHRNSNIALTAFLRALGALPTGDSALTPGLPRRAGGGKGGRKNAKAVAVGEAPGADIVATVNDVEGTWMQTLRSYIANAASAVESSSPLSGAAPLETLTVLYAHLLSSYTRTFTATAGGDAHHRKDGGDVAASAATSFAAVLLQQQPKAKGSDGNLHARLADLFAPSHGERGDGKANAGLHTSARALLSIVLAESEGTTNCSVGIVALWVLYNLFLGSAALAAKDRAGAPAQTKKKAGGAKDEDEDEEGASHADAAPTYTAAALLSAVLAHLPVRFAQAAAMSEKQAIDSVVSTFHDCLPLSQRRKGRLPESSFAPSAAQELDARRLGAASAALRGATAFYGQALAAAVDALALLRVQSAPPLLTVFMDSLFGQVVSLCYGTVGAAGSSTSVAGSGSAEKDAADQSLAMASHELLRGASSALHRLCSVPSVSLGNSLKVQLLWLLALSTESTVFAAAATLSNTSGSYSSSSSGSVADPSSLYQLLLALVQVPAVANVLESSNANIDACWLFLTRVLEESNRNSKTLYQKQQQQHAVRLLSSSTAAATPTSTTTGLFVLSQSEVMAVLALLVRHWLPRELLWRRASLLPPLVSALFESVLLGVRSGRYERRVLSQVSSLFHELVRLGIRAVEEAEDECAPAARKADNHRQQRESDADDSGSSSDEDDGDDGAARKRQRTGRSDRSGGKSHGRGASSSGRRAPVQVSAPATYSTRVMALAATVAVVFHVSRHYVSVYTTFSSDLDYVARDLLRALSRQALPKVKAAPIAFHAGVAIRPVGPSPASFSDLVYTCVGDEEGKALLRQAAMRLDEEQMEEGGGGSSEGLVERRHIFNVDV